MIKNRVHDVFFYIWIATNKPLGPVENEEPITDSNGRFYAYLEIYFPNKLLEKEKHVMGQIKQKIENAIGQPINERIVGKKGECVSDFFVRIKKNFGSLLQDISMSP